VHELGELAEALTGNVLVYLCSEVV
jgi:hypothetical protein